ncbi:TolC family protein [Cronobacter sakazakii]|uniref:TolC family protein n=1 Tax=Cronobacter sakazakii TaxID=28141 RepID=UPI000BE9471A|nr:TolC family protein [Cronobacter sakazakii]EGT5762931.1 TolC family protein [Cronobacter sakazakii]EIX1614445.1 TolC family protein [Cronobacter sakazakii]EJG0760939.1 TolC family protein [Cronobacter sakazakii]ELY2493435.1 TolC family protein [Cronobacter sakazakii]ELY3533333.1 TolC family protein [Cronobacter sakazakii]
MLAARQLQGFYLGYRQQSLRRVYLLSRHYVMIKILIAISILFVPVSVDAYSFSNEQAVSAGQEKNLTFNSPDISLHAQKIEMTLGDAIYLGLRNNRAIRSAYLNRISQKFDLTVSQDRFNPKLTLSGNYLATYNQDDRYRQGAVSPKTTILTPYGSRVSLGWNYINTKANMAGFSTNDGASITVIQPLLRGAGKNIATAPVRLAQLSEQINRLNLKSIISQTVTGIITSYRALLQAQEQLKIARESLNRSHKLVDVNRAMIAAGRMAEFEIVQAEAEVASQELNFEQARNDLDAKRLELLQLLSLDLNTPIEATESLQAHDTKVDVVQAIKQAEYSQPQWLIKLIENEQANIDLAVAHNNSQWDVSLVGGANQVRRRDNQSGVSRTWENYVGIQVEIPVNDTSIHQAEVRARVNVRNSGIQLAEAHQQLEREVTNAVRDINARWRQYEISQRARDLSLRKLEIEREKLTVGRSSNFQVLSYENDLRNAENARLNTLINYLNAQAELDQQLGTTLQSWDITIND